MTGGAGGGVPSSACSEAKPSDGTSPAAGPVTVLGADLNYMTDPYSEESLKNARVSKWYDELAGSVTKCVFCDLKEKYIVAKRGSSVLTVSLFPYIDGQMIVIPRRHVERLGEVSEAEWGEFGYLIKLGIELVEKVTGADDVNVLYREGGAAGKSVGHLHVHILPITPQFMQYDKNVGFVWRFQDIKVSPLEMAGRMREVCDEVCRDGEIAERVFRKNGTRPALQSLSLSPAGSSRSSAELRTARVSREAASPLPRVALSPSTRIEYMRQACWECDKSDCVVKTGCVAVKDGKVLLRAHNHLMPDDAGDERDRALHAEASLVASLQAALKGSILYSTRFPCLSCSVLIVNAGVKKIYYMSDLFTTGNEALPFLENKGVEVEQIKEEEVWDRVQGGTL